MKGFKRFSIKIFLHPKNIVAMCFNQAFKFIVSKCYLFTSDVRLNKLFDNCG